MQVTVISRQGKAALVEWEDAVGKHRVTLPADLVGDGSDVNYVDLQRGIPYGIAWDKVILTPITVEQIAQSFRAHGIWTENDLQRKLPAARAALQEAQNINFGFLLDAIRRSSGG